MGEWVAVFAVGGYTLGLAAYALWQHRHPMQIDVQKIFDELEAEYPRFGPKRRADKP